MRPSKIHYPDSVAPNGALMIERPSHDQLRSGIRDDDAARDIQRIGHFAYLNSQWLQAAANQHSLSPEDLASRAFAPGHGMKYFRQVVKLEQSDGLFRNPVFWFGERFKPRPSPQPEDTRYYWPTGEPQGFVKIERQVTPGSLTSRLKRIAANHVYVCIHDLCVTPETQGKGLGTALVYNGLKDQPRWLRSSLHTPESAEDIRAQAVRYGYEQVGEDTLDIFKGLNIPYAVYHASSVRRVLLRMEEEHPWLKQGEASTLGQRADNEFFDEFLSKNVR